MTTPPPDSPGKLAYLAWSLVAWGPGAEKNGWLSWEELSGFARLAWESAARAAVDDYRKRAGR